MTRLPRRALVAWLALAGAALAGCAALAPKPLPPKVELDGLRVTRLSPADTRIRVALKVANPNAYALGVSELEARMVVEGEPLATATLAAPVTLVASGETRVEIDARTTLAAVATVADRVARERRARYEVTGSAAVQDGLRLPFSRQGELPIDRLLGVAR